jgi:hypothetical protein
MIDSVYDTICSIGELIDKLSIENIKCYHVNNEVMEERQKDNPDPIKIADCEAAARIAGEQRVKLKNEINVRINDAIRRGGIKVASEIRTYK